MYYNDTLKDKESIIPFSFAYYVNCMYHKTMELKSYQRAFLRSQAQQLNPVVYVGKEGFTEGVSSSLDAALTAHELVKVRFSNKKSEVEEISRKLEESTDSTLVAITGFTSVFFRQDPKSEDRIYRI